MYFGQGYTYCSQDKHSLSKFMYIVAKASTVWWKLTHILGNNKHNLAKIMHILAKLSTIQRKWAIHIFLPENGFWEWWGGWELMQISYA